MTSLRFFDVKVINRPIARVHFGLILGLITAVLMLLLPSHGRADEMGTAESAHGQSTEGHPVQPEGEVTPRGFDNPAAKDVLAALNTFYKVVDPNRKPNSPPGVREEEREIDTTDSMPVFPTRGLASPEKFEELKK